MKITKSYLKQVIKEEIKLIEQESEVGKYSMQQHTRQIRREVFNDLVKFFISTGLDIDTANRAVRTIPREQRFETLQKLQATKTK